MSLDGCQALPAMTTADRQHLLSEVERLLPQLRRYARYLESNASTADDLLQEALLRAIDGLDSFKPGTNLRAWLFTIVRNTQINLWRKTAKHWLHDLGIQVMEQPASQPHSIVLGELEAAITNLPWQQREALLLVAVEGLSYEETAAIMGTPVGTVRSRLSRARAVLSEQLNGVTAEAG